MLARRLLKKYEFYAWFSAIFAGISFVALAVDIVWISKINVYGMILVAIPLVIALVISIVLNRWGMRNYNKLYREQREEEMEIFRNTLGRWF